MNSNSSDNSATMQFLQSHCRKVTYKLQRLINSQESHIELKDRCPEQVVVCADTPVLIKFSTYDRLAPCIISIKYAAGQKVPERPNSNPSGLPGSPIKNAFVKKMSHLQNLVRLKHVDLQVYYSPTD